MERNQSEDEPETVKELTAVVREADGEFQRVGGGTRHWVRDCFLPILNRNGFIVVRETCRHCGEDLKYIDGAWLDRETHGTCDGTDTTHQPARFGIAVVRSAV